MVGMAQPISFIRPLVAQGEAKGCYITKNQGI